MENHGLKEELEKTLDVFNKQCKDNYMGEENVKIKLVVPILEKLGWDRNDIDFEHSVVVFEDHKGDTIKRVDCYLSKYNSRHLFVEVKGVFKDKNAEKIINAVPKLKEYCINDDVKYGMLTDGINWKLYGPFICKKCANINIPRNKIVNFDNKDNDNSIEDLFANFYFEKADYLLLDGNNIYELDKIWDEVIKSVDPAFLNKYEDGIRGDDICEDSDIKVLINRLKYRLMLNGVLNVGNKDFFRRYIEKKMNERLCPSRNVTEIFNETIGVNVDTDNTEDVKKRVILFFEKLGWKSPYIENDTFAIIFKNYENKRVFCIRVDKLDKKNGGKVHHNEEDEMDNLCKTYGIQYCAVTNGIKWNFYNFNYKEKVEIFEPCCLFKEVKLEKEKIEQVADFLSMISFDNIDNLQKMVASGRFLDCILKENLELENEVKEVAKGDDEIIIASLAKKLKKEVLGIIPEIDVTEEYLKSYIRWYGQEIIEEEANAASFTVKYNKKTIKGKSAISIYDKVVKEIGYEKISKITYGHFPIAMHLPEGLYYKSKKYNILPADRIKDGFLVRRNFDKKTIIEILNEIREELCTDLEVVSESNK